MTTILRVLCGLLLAGSVMAQTEDPSADAILAQTKAAYAGLSSLCLKGTVTHPWVTPNAAPPEVAARLAPQSFVMVMARPCLYRTEADTGQPRPQNRVVTWSDGKAHHQFYGRAAHVIEDPDKDQARCFVTAPGALPFELFFSVPVIQFMSVGSWQRLKDAPLDGVPCYVIEAAGMGGYNRLRLHIGQADCLIRELEYRTEPWPVTDQAATWFLQMGGERPTPEAIAKMKKKLLEPEYKEGFMQMSLKVTYTAIEVNHPVEPKDIAYQIPAGMQELHVPARKLPKAVTPPPTPR